MVDIFVQYPGASSAQVASLVADPLERLMSEIPGVEHVYSASLRDQAMVTVQFDVGEDMESSLVKLYDKLQSNVDRIPPGVSQPLVKPKSVDDVPVVTLTLWSESLDDSMLRLIGLEVLQRLKEIPNTSQSFIVSGRTEQLRIEPLPERLTGYGVTLDQLAGTIRAANSERGVGQLESAGQSLQVYTGSFLRHADDVERLMVGVREGRPLYVRDIAEVIAGPSETHSMVKYYTGPANESGLEADAAPAVTLAIAKKTGTNGVLVANDILARVEQLKGSAIPDNVNVAITRNYGETANDKVNELIFKLFVATGAVTLLIWLFLGLRAALVVLFVIPVVILVTVFSAWIIGYTIDRVSLFALIFSIGILVDDAIVVVENIYRRWLLKGETDTETAVDAVSEVGNPTILATFTVIAALLPMGFVSGMMGPYMEPIPALGSVAMLFSLFAAFIFTPWLTMRLKPSLSWLGKTSEKEHRQSERLEGFFHRLIFGMVNNKLAGYGFLIGIVVLFFALCLLFYTTHVRVKMLPLDNKPEFNVVINFPEGTALPLTANLTDELARVLRDIPEVTALQAYVGTASPFNFNGLVRHYYLRQQPWEADIQVQLTHKAERDRTSHDIAVEARELLTPIALDAGAQIQVVEMPPGPPVLQSVVAEIYGPDPQTRRQVARDFTEMFAQAEHLADVDNYLQTPYEVWHFQVDRDKALRYGVSVEDVNRTLEMAMGGFVLGDLKTQSQLDPTLIVLQLPLEVRSEFGRLGQLPVPTAAGEMVPLAELGRFEQTFQDDPIYHKDLRAVEYVTAETVGRLAAPIYGMLEVEEQLVSYTAPDGVQPKGHYLGPPPDSNKSGFEWGGEWTVTYETFRDMGMAFGVALVLIYMLVVYEFGNFILPAIVMAPIPLTLIGIIPGHWLFNAEFTATSMIGFIALAGIIVRNSILLVEFSREAVERGMEVDEAMVKACQARTRPIVITALALVAGSSVILFDPIFQGMAISLMFGTLVSTLLTLVVIPLGCISARAAFCPTATDTNGESHAVCETDGARPDSAGSPVTAWLFAPIKYAGLYAYALSSSIWEGLRDLLLALARLVGNLGGGGPRVATATAGGAPAPRSEAVAAERSTASAAKAPPEPEPAAGDPGVEPTPERVSRAEVAPIAAPEPEPADVESATPKKAAAKKSAAKRVSPNKTSAKKAPVKTTASAKTRSAPKKKTPAKKNAQVKKKAPAKKRSAPTQARTSTSEAADTNAAPGKTVESAAPKAKARPKAGRKGRRGIRLKNDSNE
jgi:multidrug efflux pump subunit AcrB